MRLLFAFLKLSKCDGDFSPIKDIVVRYNSAAFRRGDLTNEDSEILAFLVFTHGIPVRWSLRAGWSTSEEGCHVKTGN